MCGFCQRKKKKKRESEIPEINNTSNTSIHWNMINKVHFRNYIVLQFHYVTLCNINYGFDQKNFSHTQ